MEDDGYQVLAIADWSVAVASAQIFRPDLALVDGLLSGGHGAEVARGLRKSRDLPIIFVTGAHSAEDIHRGFEMGADDYIIKPFDPEELVWRVRAVLRRAGHSVTQIWELGDLVVDEGTQEVTRASQQVRLTTTEFKMLGALIRNRNRVVPKSEIVSEVWGYVAADHVIEVHMSSLRAKLEAHGPRMIQTVRGLGYILRP